MYLLIHQHIHLALSTTSDGSHGGGSEYTTGVTQRFKCTITLTYVVPTGAPHTILLLYIS